MGENGQGRNSLARWILGSSQLHFAVLNKSDANSRFPLFFLAWLVSPSFSSIRENATIMGALIIWSRYIYVTKDNPQFLRNGENPSFAEQVLPNVFNKTTVFLSRNTVACIYKHKLLHKTHAFVGSFGSLPTALNFSILFIYTKLTPNLKFGNIQKRQMNANQTNAKHLFRSY